MSTIAENLMKVKARIASACARAGRHPAEVTLVAVTKSVTAKEAEELYFLGVRDFGENRVADGAERLRALHVHSDARRHLIGHLQRNKAREALAGGFLTIHSVESDKLLDVLDREAEKLDLRPEILLEANISGEESKYGAPPDGLPRLVELALAKKNLHLTGLMTMAPLDSDPEAARPVFRGLRECRDDLERRFGVELPRLSMGMTGDFETAVEEGATMVRIGTALFH